MKQIIKHFTDNDLYTFTCQYFILEKYPRAEVEYTFFDRNKTKYPKGFDKILQEQMNYMKSVIITDEEINFFKDKCKFLPEWYITTFLKGYRFNPNELSISQNDEGHLSIKIKGKWYSTIMWEMPILSTISELMHIINGDANSYNYELERNRIIEKANKIYNSDGFKLADMGTRRRFSFEHQELFIKTFIDTINRNRVMSYKNNHGCLIGTSNVYFAFKYNLIPIGTMSHQIISFEENVSGIKECNFNVMDKWSNVYDGNNGIYLYDCFGDNVFFDNLSKKMALLYNGLRVDSGIEEEQLNKIMSKYKQLGINPKNKQIVFSNGLSIDRAIDIHKYVNGEMQDSYGIGTNLTCDVKDVSPMNIVVKLTKGRLTEYREWNECVKLSCDKGKTLGDKNKCDYLLSIINNK